MDEATLFVAAIDLGTTYSGYAFSTKSQPENIYTCDWKNTTLISNKAPTSLLLNNRKQFLAFGYDAEAKYTESLENDSDDEEEKDELLFFRRFKMILHNKSVDMDTMIEDESGFEMKAIDVFTIAIQYLKEQIIMKLKQTLKAVDESDIHFVLTVPGIWEDRAKYFMRKAAEKKHTIPVLQIGSQDAFIYRIVRRLNGGIRIRTVGRPSKIRIKGTKYRLLVVCYC